MVNVSEKQALGLLTAQCNRFLTHASISLASPVVYNNTEYAMISDATVYASSQLKLMTLEYTLFNQLPLNICGKWTSQIENVNDQGQAAYQMGGNRRHLADEVDGADGDAADADAADGDAADAADADAAEGDAADAEAADADEADASGYEGGDMANCPDGLYSLEVSYTLPSADSKTAWLATGWTGSGVISMYAEKGNTDSLVGYCTLKLGTAVTQSQERKYNPPTALVASLIAVGVVVAVFLLCIYCTCCRYRRPPRNKEYLDHDPIEMDRSRSEASYQSMSGGAKPWASTGSKSSGRQWA